MVLKGVHKDGDRHFSKAFCDRTRGNGFQPKQGKFRSDIRKNFFNEGDETLEHIAQKSGGCPSPETFKVRLHSTLNYLTCLKMSLLTAEELD